MKKPRILTYSVTKKITTCIEILVPTFPLAIQQALVGQAPEPVLVLEEYIQCLSMGGVVLWDMWQYLGTFLAVEAE